MSDYPSPAALLPHGYPFIFIDKIITLEPGARIVCLKNFTITEEFFKGHFRETPLVPGVLLIEAMAQASGLLAAGRSSLSAYLSRVNDARFKRPVTAGDQLFIASALIQAFPPLHVFECTASVGDEVVASAEITLALA